MWDKMLSHTRMGIPYEYTHVGRPIRVWANIRIWGRTATHVVLMTFELIDTSYVAITHQSTIWRFLGQKRHTEALHQTLSGALIIYN